MDVDIALLQKTMLFSSMAEAEVAEALRKLRAEEKSYEKGEVILHAGNTTSRMGLVLHGSVTVESNDMWGNRTILSLVGKLQFFAETYALLEEEPLLVDAVANEKCRVLFLHIGSIRQIKGSTEPWALKLAANLLTISAHKNLMLSGRSFHTSPKTVRERVMAYLNSTALQKHSREFDIPFDRQQLADYLNLDRTALSKELGRMQREGILQTKRRHFVLLEQ